MNVVFGILFALLAIAAAIVGVILFADGYGWFEWSMAFLFAAGGVAMSVISFRED